MAQVKVDDLSVNEELTSDESKKVIGGGLFGEKK
jgi:hypothetical protein